MNENITYCCNEECKNKYRCERFKNEKYGKDFWFSKYDPKTCGEFK